MTINIGFTPNQNPFTHAAVTQSNPASSSVTAAGYLQQITAGTSNTLICVATLNPTQSIKQTLRPSVNGVADFYSAGAGFELFILYTDANNYVSVSYEHGGTNNNNIKLNRRVAGTLTSTTYVGGLADAYLATGDTISIGVTWAGANATFTIKRNDVDMGTPITLNAFALTSGKAAWVNQKNGSNRNTMAEAIVITGDVVGPNQLVFDDQIGVARSSARTSNEQTIAGLSAPLAFTVEGAGGAEINNSGNVVTSGTVSNGDTVELHHNASASYSTSVNTSFICGSMTAVFVSETIAAPEAITVNGDNTVTEGSSIALESSGVTLTGATALYLRRNTRKVTQSSLVVVDADSATANHVLAVANVGVPFTTTRHAIYCGITVGGVDHEVEITHEPSTGLAHTIDPASMSSTDGSLFKSLVAYFAGLGLATSINDQCVAPSSIGATPTTWLLDASGNMTGFVDQGPQTGSDTARYWLAANETFYDINFTLVDGSVDTVAPNLVAGPTITNITQTTADFTATPNDAGFYGVAVLPATTAIPLDSAILTGTVSGSLWSRSETAMFANTPVSGSLAALAAGGSWRIHIALRDTAATPNTRVISSAAFNTLGADTTAPNLSSGPSISNIALTTATLSATPDDAGFNGIVILPSTSATPLADPILAGSVVGAVFSRSETAMSAGVQFTVPLTSMAQGQSYRAHVALRDTASPTPNTRVVTSAIFTMQTVGDVTAPNFSSGPGITNLQSTSLDVTFIADEAGQYRIVMVPALATPPLVDEVLAGTGNAGAVADSVSALLSMSAGAIVLTPMTGLTPGLTYIPYIALRDGAPNRRLGNAGPVTMPIVPDGIDPTITITVASLGIFHTITATVADNVGVVGVSFMLNGQPLGAELSSAPWQWTWNATGFTGGNYSITAQARDGANNTTLSNSVLVQLANQSQPDVAPVSRSGRGTYEQRGAVWYRVEEKN